MQDYFKEHSHNLIKYDGIFNNLFHYIEDIQLLRTDLWCRFVQQFKEDADYEGGWRGEFWGKMMRGACFVYSYTQNPQLYTVLHETILDILSAQEENGRISSYGIFHEFEAWDIWGRKYVLLGMQYFLEICKDDELSKRITDSMCRQVDYIMLHIGDPNDGKILITKATRHWRGLNSSSILEPIVRLYNITKEQKYLDFATYIVECGGIDNVNIFELAYEDVLYPYQYPVTKAYEMISCFEGLLEYYRVTKIKKYKTCVVNFANKILESDFTIIGCCGCTHELFDHSTVRQANTTNGRIVQETCVTVTIMKFLYQLTLLTGDSKYVDAFEISLYNAYLGSINTENAIHPSILAEHPDWNAESLPFDSYSPLTAGIRGNGIGGLRVMSDNHYYGCCACIGAAGIGLVPKMGFLTTERGYAVNLFINGSVEADTARGNKVVFQTVTEYPINGKVVITVDITEKESFELMIRIPAWSECSSISVNGVEQLVTVGYTRIRREWLAGDCVEIELDLHTQAIRPIPYGNQILMNQVDWVANDMKPTFDEEDPVAKNHLALRRGPIILAQDNRLGYNLEEPVDIEVEADNYVLTTFPEEKIAPYEHILEMEVPLVNGMTMRVTDYASAGKTWTEESKMAAWILVEN